MDWLSRTVQEFQSYKGKNVLILCHDHADSDAVGAAYALAAWLDGTIGVPSEVATHAKGLMDALQVSVVRAPAVETFDHVIVVDTAHPSQLKGMSLPTFWLVDHHPDNTIKKWAKGMLCDSVSSTSQLVYRILKAANVPISSRMALALSAGILTDTINFHKGDSEAFRVFGELLETGNLSLEQVKRLYAMGGRDDRQVIVRAALSASMERLENFIILYTTIKANIPTFVARALFDLGADVSIVGHDRQGEVEIRMYVRDELAETCGLDAAQILRDVSGLNPDCVWGYRLFAAYRSPGDVDRLIAAIVGKIKTLVCRKQEPEITTP
jgi:phosphoesterase RecJ-like protein